VLAVMGCRIRTATFSASDANQGKEYSREQRKDFFDKRGGDETPERDMSVVIHLMCAHAQTGPAGASQDAGGVRDRLADPGMRPSSNGFGVNCFV
jgi:hypothetical protein